MMNDQFGDSLDLGHYGMQKVSMALLLAIINLMYQNILPNTGT